jgi:hypothetical protein
VPHEVPSFRIILHERILTDEVDTEVATDAARDGRMCRFDARIDDRDGDPATVRVPEDRRPIEALERRNTRQPRP